MNALILSVVILWCCFGTKAQITFSDKCRWNYTQTDKDGKDVNRVFVFEEDQCSYPNPGSTRSLFNIDDLGTDRDIVRKVDISWDTSKLSSIVMISIADMNDSNAAAFLKCFRFEIKGVKRKIQSTHLTFDCLEIPRGVRKFLRICDLGRPRSHEPKYSRQPVCSEKEIDTRSCGCSNSTVVQAELRNKKGITNYTIYYKWTSPEMKMSIHVERNTTIVFERDGLRITSNGSPIKLPDDVFADPGNYTVRVSLYCLDYSNSRQYRMCKTDEKYLEVPPSDKPPDNEHEHYLLPHIMVAVICVCLIVCICVICYGRRTNIKNIFQRCCAQSYDQVTREAPNCPLNNSHSDRICQENLLSDDNKTIDTEENVGKWLKGETHQYSTEQ